MVAMKRLWVHEVLRVYYDRLVDDSDRSWIIEALREVCMDKLGEDLNAMFKRLTSSGNTQVGGKTITLPHTLTVVKLIDR